MGTFLRHSVYNIVALTYILTVVSSPSQYKAAENCGHDCCHILTCVSVCCRPADSTGCVTVDATSHCIV